MDAFVEFLKSDSNIKLLVELSAVAVALACGYIAYTNLFLKKKPGSDFDTSQLGDLEATLLRVLEKADPAVIKSAGGGAAAATTDGEAAPAEGDGGESEASAPAEGGADPAELKSLQSELMTKEQEIIDLKKELDESKAASDGGGTDELEAKIKVLEDKLAEYEIIEDDIADLSAFKEENQKLKEELSALKGGGAAPAPAAAEAPAAEAPAPAAEAPAEEVVPAKAADAPAAETAAAEAPKEQDPLEAMAAGLEGGEAPVVTPEEPSLVDEFEKAVNEKAVSEVTEGGESETPAVRAEEAPAAEAPAAEAPAAPAPEAPAPAAEAPSADAPPAAQDDILAEFTPEGGGESDEITAAVMSEIEANVKGEATASSPTTESDEGIDTDKMLDELANMGAGDEGGSGLDDSTDMEKMAQEAGELLKSD